MERIRYPRFVAVPQSVFSLAPKPSLTCETPDPTQSSPPQPNPRRISFLMGTPASRFLARTYGPTTVVPARGQVAVSR